MPDILSSLPPSPGWVPFWRSLFHAALPAFSVWFCVRMAGLSYSIVIALMGYASIGAVDIVGIVWDGYEDGWTELLVTECLGQTTVVSMYTAAIFYVLSFRPRRSDNEVEAGATFMHIEAEVFERTGHLPQLSYAVVPFAAPSNAYIATCQDTEDEVEKVNRFSPLVGPCENENENENESDPITVVVDHVSLDIDPPVIKTPPNRS
ncbi:hypothetical protein BP00DRAFT_442714 [Aspergillus indologenus CBS 114.80]|uniref:Uncharacterized protein n=1 Tax=Aspergillus indologenus CBS 114.80 TaxID=1450541 RepID=A0A2V5IJQ2_9EURO|nr:hypothetical protein BP00DRAFT_442714 [Aspergillus indologenus CBS 114.80]